VEAEKSKARRVVPAVTACDDPADGSVTTGAQAPDLRRRLDAEQRE
jgi:hypothetical protein